MQDINTIVSNLEARISLNIKTFEQARKVRDMPVHKHNVYAGVDDAGGDRAVRTPLAPPSAFPFAYRQVHGGGIVLEHTRAPASADVAQGDEDLPTGRNVEVVF